MLWNPSTKFPRKYKGKKGNLFIIYQIYYYLLV